MAIMASFNSKISQQSIEVTTLRRYRNVCIIIIIIIITIAVLRF